MIQGMGSNPMHGMGNNPSQDTSFADAIRVLISQVTQVINNPRRPTDPRIIAAREANFMNTMSRWAPQAQRLYQRVQSGLIRPDGLGSYIERTARTFFGREYSESTTDRNIQSQIILDLDSLIAFLTSYRRFLAENIDKK
jgi:hypothetical protein